MKILNYFFKGGEIRAIINIDTNDKGEKNEPAKSKKSPCSI